MDQTAIQDRVVGGLRKAATHLNQARLPELSQALDRLAAEASDPCVVAIIGRMKAGKSSFLNALLKEDLAKIGVTETTATINRFVYGSPDVQRPVRCHWKNGKVTSESKSFLDSLQGNDAETLQRAMEIKFLEYALENPYLQDVVLADTPGLCTTVEEHKERSAEFLHLADQLSKQHDEANIRLRQQADAVIYLLGEVARQTDEALLADFHAATNGHSDALNAVGVLSKVDMSPGVLKRRHQLSKKIANQLKGSLNTVIPVSAGIRRALDRMATGDLPPLDQYVCQLRQIPKVHLEKFLDNEDFYRELEPEDCPITIEMREELLADLPWTVLTRIAHVSTNLGPDVSHVRQELDDLSGFDKVTRVLDEHLFQRSRFLRLYRTVQDATAIIEPLRFGLLIEARKRDLEMRQKLERFLTFVREAEDDQEVGRELENYLIQNGPRTTHGSRLQAVYAEIARDLAELRIELEEHSHDFEALQNLQTSAGLFSAEELDELQALLGMHGLDSAVRLGGSPTVERAAARQVYWRSQGRFALVEMRKTVSARADQVYGKLIDGLLCDAAVRE